jgi:hypothetical protein
MTQQKHLKELVRARMEKTGERYATARRHVIGQADEKAAARSDGPHFPGNVPASTALRVLLTAAGVRAPHTGRPLTEAMVFGLAGGIGAGTFAFSYEKANFASFFVAGRHDWADEQRYLETACRRLGASTTVLESSGAKPASQALTKALADGQPCIAWVDATGLPHRGLPQKWSGGAYHLITIYDVDEKASIAHIGDLADQPIAIPLDALADARARIKKDKRRLLTLSAPKKPLKLDVAVRDALAACHAGLHGAKGKGNAKTNFSLASFQLWGQRLHDSRDQESWERIFTPGSRLWRGLTSICEYVEYHGTGGGLSRPIFAEFLQEAGEALGDKSMLALSRRYAELGKQWSDLADAALPDEVPMMREAKSLLARRAELLYSAGPDAVEERQRVSARREELSAAAAKKFPLSDGDCTALRAKLQERVLALYDGEMAALKDLP